jgi:hypothetical protein
MRDEGKSWRTIAKALDIPVSTIREACAEKVSETSANNNSKVKCNFVAAF